MEIAQAEVLAARFMPARRTQVEKNPEAFGDCTSCGIGGSGARQDYTSQVKT